jgi:aspartate-semialdehyde dehydrogenase
MRKSLHIAVVGCTGAVGVEMLKCLDQLDLPVGTLSLLASKRSAGSTMAFKGMDIRVEELTSTSFKGVDIALFSAGSSISKAYRQAVLEAGCVMIDNSSAFRMEADVPLVLPEVNPEAAKTHKGVIANPNCSTIIALVPLWPLHQHTPIVRLNAATYQAASGAGYAAMQELEAATRAYLAGTPFAHSVLPHPYAFNLFSHNASIDPQNGYNEEEMKLVNETRKIFNAPSIRVAATCVRVPVLRAHCEALSVEFASPMPETTVRALLSQAPGVRVVDDRAANYFPMPIDASGQGDILVGRIRQDISDPSGHCVQMFVAGDQLLKGAALNAVQIAKLLI